MSVLFFNPNKLNKNTMPEEKYFKRKINEGTIKRTHLCSFDKKIKLDMIVQSGKKTVEYIMKLQAKEVATDKKVNSTNDAEENFRKQLSSVRINDLPVVYEDLINSFDDEEILEVITFINDGDMSDYGGKKSPKNA